MSIKLFMDISKSTDMADVLNLKGMDGVFLSYVMPDDVAKQVFHLDPKAAVQTQRFALNTIDVLQKVFSRLAVYSFAPIQDFPVARKIFFPVKRFRVNGSPAFLLPFVNLLVLKHVTRFFSLLASAPGFLRANYLIVHGLHLPYLLFGRLMRFAKCRVGVVLTDEQGIVLETDSALRAILKRMDGCISRRLASGFDFGISLTGHLADCYVPGKPAVVFPGIYNDSLEESIRVEQSHPLIHQDRFRVLYFGGLSVAYGIDRLIDAVAHLHPDVELRLFGQGPLEAAIAEKARIDSRLFWGGFVGIDRLVEEIAHCNLLVNPRPSDTRLARMSAPSKLLEYAASGRPVLTTRLESIPSAFHKALLWIEDESSTGIAAAINEAATLSLSELDCLGLEFQESVRSLCNINILSIQFRSLLLSVETAENPFT